MKLLPIQEEILNAQQQMIYARQPEYPPKQSMSGQNTATVTCEEAGYTPGYAVCLHKLEARERDGQLKDYPYCDRAYGFKCPAQKLRAEEQAAGKALFFVDRREVMLEWDKETEALNARTRRPTPPPKVWKTSTMPVRQPIEIPLTGKRSEPAAIQRATPKPATPEYAMPTYADAINKAIRDEMAAEAAPAPVSAAAPATPMSTQHIVKRPDESMAEYAARVMEARKQKEV